MKTINRYICYMRQLWDKIPRWIRNKYFVTTLCFIVWLMFFDANDLITQVKLTQQLNKLKAEKQEYAKKIEATEITLDELLTDNNELERFAREKFLMKKDNEEIFVIVTEEKED